MTQLGSFAEPRSRRVLRAGALYFGPAWAGVVVH